MTHSAFSCLHRYPPQRKQPRPPPSLVQSACCYLELKNENSVTKLHILLVVPRLVNELWSVIYPGMLRKATRGFICLEEAFSRIWHVELCSNL